MLHLWIPIWEVKQGCKNWYGWFSFGRTTCTILHKINNKVFYSTFRTVKFTNDTTMARNAYKQM